MNPNELLTKGDLSPVLQKIEEAISLLSKQTVKRQPEVIYLTSAEVCAKYKLSKSQLKAMRDERKIPFAKPFGVIIYQQSLIEEIIMKSMEVQKPTILNNSSYQYQ